MRVVPFNPRSPAQRGAFSFAAFCFRCVLFRLLVLFLYLRAMMADSASDRRSGNAVMSGDVPQNSSDDGPRKASRLGVSDQPDAENQRNDCALEHRSSPWLLTEADERFSP